MEMLESRGVLAVVEQIICVKQTGFIVYQPQDSSAPVLSEVTDALSEDGWFLFMVSAILHACDPEMRGGGRNDTCSLIYVDKVINKLNRTHHTKYIIT